MADTLFACGLVKAREEQLLSRGDLLRLVDETTSWDEAGQLLDRAGLATEPEEAWRKSPRTWAAQAVADEARAVAALLPDHLAPFPLLRIEAHNLGRILLHLRGEDTPGGGELPGGRIDRQGIEEGAFPPPWERDELLWTSLRDRTADHPLGTAAACRLAAVSYQAELLRGSGSEPLADLAEKRTGVALLGLLVRAKRQGRPWSSVAPFVALPESVAGGLFDTIYPLPIEEWAGLLADPWGPLLATSVGRGEAGWDALCHEVIAPAIGDAWRDTLSVGPVIAWFLLRELQAGIAGFALEAKLAGLDQASAEEGVPRVFA